MARFIFSNFPLQTTDISFALLWLFMTIRTLLPSGVKDASFGRSSGTFDATLTEPHLKNLAALARIKHSGFLLTVEQSMVKVPRQE